MLSESTTAGTKERVNEQTKDQKLIVKIKRKKIDAGLEKKASGGDTEVFIHIPYCAHCFTRY